MIPNNFILFGTIVGLIWLETVHSCSVKEWQCDDGSCISKHSRCDGVVQCNDGSDELHCRSTRSQIGSCEFPTPPDNITSYTTNIANVKSGEAYDYIEMNVTCPEGYGVPGETQYYCYLGNWWPSIRIPICTPRCYLPPHDSVEYRCLLTGPSDGFRTCNTYEYEGTEVNPVCKTPFYHSLTDFNYMRCHNGHWDYIAKCIPDCGRVTGFAVDLISGGKMAEHGEVPWHAAIYTKETDPYKQICGGSIISTNIVLSAAHCFWDNYNKQAISADKYAVAVGKMYRKWDEPRDEAQKSDVKAIHIPARYQGSASHNQNDIAVVVVATKFIYQTHVRPVCIDFDDVFQSRQLSPMNMGKIAGWGGTSSSSVSSPTLKVIRLPYVTIETCLQNTPEPFHAFITNDKICAGFIDNGEALCQGDSGGGLAFLGTHLRDTQRYFLRGIASASSNDKNSECNVNTYTTFTSLQSYQYFIKKYLLAEDNRIPGEYTRPVSADNYPDCIMPAYPEHGMLFTNILNVKPGQSYDHLVINMTCRHGYGVQGSRQLTCSDGHWWPTDELPQCVPLCDLPSHSSVEYLCQEGEGQEMKTCSTQVPSGSVVTPKCQTPLYYSREYLEQMKCNNGSWNYIAKCIPDCGVSSIRFEDEGEDLSGPYRELALEAGDGYQRRQMAPWHVSIYRQENHELVCGGSLIRNDVVLTAARCFWINNMDEMQPTVDFAVAAGKAFWPWDSTKDDPQISDIKHIHLPKEFKSTIFNGRHDIAIVVVTTPFEYDLYVRPACVNFGETLEKRQIQEGKLGLLAAWDVKSDYDKRLHLLAPNITAMQDQFWVDDTNIFRDSDTKVDAILCNMVNRGTGWMSPVTAGGRQRYYLRGIKTNSCNFIPRLQLHKDFISGFLRQGLTNV